MGAFDPVPVAQAARTDERQDNTTRFWIDMNTS